MWIYTFKLSGGQDYQLEVLELSSRSKRIVGAEREVTKMIGLYSKRSAVHESLPFITSAVIRAAIPV